MQTYRLTFDLASPYLTPWQADTLFGHLCWALVRLEGTHALGHFLERYQVDDAPLLLSDGFPPDRFPRPLLPLSRLPDAGLPDQMAAARRGKALRDSKWLTGEQFVQMLRGEIPETSMASFSDLASSEQPFTILNNAINRLTGTTSGQDGAGNLFVLEGEATTKRVVFLRVAEDLDIDWRSLFQEVAQTGFGKRKSVGYGAIRHLEIEPLEGFGEPDAANGFVSLSSFVP